MPPSLKARRRRQRLMIIASVVMLLVLAVVGRWAYVQSTGGPRDTGPNRETALATYQSGDYPAAIAQLSKVAKKNDRDIEVLYALAMSHLEVPQPKGENIGIAAHYLNQVVTAQPTHHEAASELLDLYAVNPRGAESEVLSLTDIMLKQNPKHEGALRVRGQVQQMLGRHDAALQTILTYLEINPTDALMQRKVLESMAQMNQPSAALIARAEAELKKHPDDPRLEYVLAYAHYTNRDRAKAVELLKQAALRPPPDKDFIKLMVQFMDAAAMFPENLAYLRKNTNKSDATGLRQELVRRLFETGQLDEATQMFNAIEQKPDAGALAVQVIALREMDRDKDAEAVLKDLENPERRADAKAWATLLRTAYKPEVSADEVIAAGVAARNAGVNDPYAELIIGSAYERGGDSESAKTAFENAANRRPSWSSPRMSLARIAIREGNRDTAVQNAVAAAVRAPTNIETHVLSAMAVAMNPSAIKPGEMAELERVIDQIQQVDPGEPRTLLLRVRLMGEIGRTSDAVAAARVLMNKNNASNAAPLMQLADFSRHYDLGITDEVYQLINKRHGAQPSVAQSRALDIAKADGNDAALAAFDQSAGTAINTTPWQLARAQLLDQLDHPQAAAAWVKVADANPNDLAVQQAALRTRATWTDRDLTRRCIDRLRELSSANDEAWRVELARWLLNGPQPQSQAAQVETLLQDYTKNNPPTAQVLLMRASAQSLLGQQQVAIKYLVDASNLEPNDALIRLELAAAYQRADSSAQASAQLRQVLSQRDLTPQQRRRAAQLLIDQRDFATAIEPLEDLRSSGDAEPLDLLSLGQLYAQTQQHDKAVAIIPAILAEPTEPGVLYAASVYARLGQPDKAYAILDKLSDLNLSPAKVHTLRGSHLSMFAAPEEAMPEFVAATEADPSDPLVWRNLTEFQLRIGQADQAIATARRGIKAAGNDDALAAIERQAKAITRVGDTRSTIPLVAALLGQPQQRDAAEKALTLFHQAAEKQTPPVTLADQLKKLSDANPDFAELSLATIDVMRQANQLDTALQRAEAAMARFPDSGPAAQYAAELQANAGRWSQSLLAAQAWRRRDPVNRPLADTLIARAQLNLGRPSEALATLLPHRDLVAASPNRYPPVTRDLAFLLAKADRAGEARTLLEPLLSQDARWRMTALDTATRAINDHQVAAQWLERVNQAIPQDAVAELTHLAQAWWSLGQRDSQPGYRDQARHLAQSLSLRPDADAGVFFFRGVIAEYDEDWPSAENAYRRVLKLQPDSASARNNLAVVLSKAQGNHMDEAIRLAGEAVKSYPTQPTFHDTLAMLFAEAERFDDAERSIRQAIQLDPTNPEWQRRLQSITQQRNASSAVN